MVSAEACPAAHVEIHSQINMQILIVLTPNLTSIQNQVQIWYQNLSYQFLLKLESITLLRKFIPCIVQRGINTSKNQASETSFGTSKLS